jgi:hypothetical protein
MAKKEQKTMSPFARENAGINHPTPISYRDELGRFMASNKEQLGKRYQDKESLMTEVLKYLETCNESQKNPTVTGLAIALGFKSRRSILIYEKEPGYEFAYDVISYAKMKIEEFLEERLLDSRNTNIAGLIFNLKNNFDWADKQEIKMDQRSMILQGFKMIRADDEPSGD